MPGGRIRRGVAALLFGAVLLAAPAGAETAGLATLPDDVLAAVNGVRAAEGLPPLASDQRLRELSQSYAAIMAASGCMAHDCGGLGRVGERAQRAGLSYRLIGEALAGGPPDAGRVVALWLGSPSHRDILLNPEISNAGVGHARNDGEGPAGYGHYWVLTVSLPE